MNKGVVLRGGSWRYRPMFARAGYRCVWSPDHQYYYGGFRIVRTA